MNCCMFTTENSRLHEKETAHTAVSFLQPESEGSDAPATVKTDNLTGHIRRGF